LGLRIEPVGTAGAVRVVGAGVDLLAADIHDVDVRELEPPKANFYEADDT